MLPTDDAARRHADAEDDRLVRRTLAGDPQAFGRLVDRYGSRVIAICARVAGETYDDAQDVAQEVFLRAYNNLAKYELGRSFFAWLYRIAVNLALNRRSRRPPPTVGGAAGALLLGRLHNSDPAGQPAVHAEQAERSAAVARAVAALPPDYAAVLALRYGADLDYSEIAVTLGVPLGTVKARLHRAKALLRPLLAAVEGDED